MTKCYVITRSFMENCYLDCFIEHYIKLNFTQIIILKSDDFDYIIPNQYYNKVKIYKVLNEGNKIYDNNKHLYKNLNGWFLFVDVDEFLVLNTKYNNNIIKFTNDIINLNKNVNIVFFRWAMIEKYNNNTNGINIQNIVKNYYKFKNYHIKSMVKSDVLVNMQSPHCPHINIEPLIYFENNFITNNSPEHNINNKSYLDCYLLHIHSRSLINIVTKSLNSYENMCKKQISNKNDFIKYINENKFLESKDLLNDFKNLIGTKAKLPFAHSNNNFINIKFPSINHDKTLINLEMENNMLKWYCKQNSINYNNICNYFRLLNTYGNHLFKNSDFNWEKYLNNYVDLKDKLKYNRESALKHYLENGIYEKRKYT